MSVDTPFESRQWIQPDYPASGAERDDAARMVLRLAGSDETAARTVLAALGLLDDKEQA